MLNRFINYWHSFFNKTSLPENYIVLASSDKTILDAKQNSQAISLHQFTVDNFFEDEFINIASSLRNTNRIKPLAAVIISISLTEILNSLPLLITNFAKVLPKLSRLKSQLSLYVIIKDFDQIAGFDSYSEIFNSSGLQLEFNSSNLQEQIDEWLFDISGECEAAFIHKGVIHLPQHKYTRFFLFKEQLELLFEPICQFINNVNSKCMLIKLCRLHKLFLIPSTEHDPCRNIFFERMTYKLNLQKTDIKYSIPEPNVVINFNLNEIFDEHHKFGYSLLVFRFIKTLRFLRKYALIIITALALIIYLQVSSLIL